jgi:hypothetical protein
MFFGVEICGEMDPIRSNLHLNRSELITQSLSGFVGRAFHEGVFFIAPHRGRLKETKF